MDEVMEVCVATMHLLARDVTCRSQLRQLNCVPLIVQVSRVFPFGGVMLVFPPGG